MEGIFDNKGKIASFFIFRKKYKTKEVFILCYVWYRK